jgi:hypothetical protein
MAAKHRRCAWALDTGGCYGKLNDPTSLDRFQADDKWERSDYVCRGLL